MQILIKIPEAEGGMVLAAVRDKTGLRQMDEEWTVEKRKKDNATMEYYPIPDPPDRKVNW